MNYKEINAENGTIAIGYIGDNLASKVIFDTSEIVEVYGTDGVFDLLVRQQTNRHCPPKVYPATIETDGNDVIWYPTAQDTSSGQYMDVELVYTIGEQVVYNRMFRCVCKKSLANDPVVQHQNPAGLQRCWRRRLILEHQQKKPVNRHRRRLVPQPVPAKVHQPQALLQAMRLHLLPVLLDQR